LGGTRPGAAVDPDGVGVAEGVNTGVSVGPMAAAGDGVGVAGGANAGVGVGPMVAGGDGVGAASPEKNPQRTALMMMVRVAPTRAAFACHLIAPLWIIIPSLPDGFRRASQVPAQNEALLYKPIGGNEAIFWTRWNLSPASIARA